MKPGFGPSPPDLEAKGFSPSSFRDWLSLEGAGGGAHSRDEGAWAGVSGREGPGFRGEEQSEAGSLGADREKVWVGLQAPCSEGPSPPEMAPRLWQRAEGDH